jgi:hypothetical protein
LFKGVKNSSYFEHDKGKVKGARSGTNDDSMLLMQKCLRRQY